MPELPEVEIYRRYVEKHAVGHRIESVRVNDARVLDHIAPAALQRQLRGRLMTSTRRHGKHLFVATDASFWMHLHFGMTGDIIRYEQKSEAPRFGRVVLQLSPGGFLAFDDPRLFGRVGLVDSPLAYIAARGLGPDPLDRGLRAAEFSRLLAGRRGAIKALLMSQEVIAGLGNLYADETLFQTSIHPLQPAGELSAQAASRLLLVIRRILRGTIERKLRGADYPPAWLIQHRAEGERCPRCGGRIRKSTVGGRTTFHCDRHQRLNVE